MRKNRLIGKSREEIDAALRTKRRAELIDVIYSLATCEPMLSPRELAARREMSKHKILELIKRGVIRAHKPLENAVRVPLSAIRDWDAQTALFFSPNEESDNQVTD